MGTSVEEVTEFAAAEYRRMMTYAVSKFNNVNDAEDIVSDSIIRMIEHVRSHPDKTIENIGGYLWKVLNFAIIDKYRKNSRHGEPVSMEEYELDAPSQVMFGEKKSGHRHPQLQVEHDIVGSLHRDDCAEVVRRAIGRQLTEGQATAIRLRCLEGMSFAEVSETMFPDEPAHDTIGRVKALVHRGKENLRIALGKSPELA